MYEKLLTDELETYYWAGFFMADGYSYDLKRIIITLSKKDEEHLKKLKEYLHSKNRIYEYSVKNKYKCVRLNIYNNEIVSKFCKKFGWNLRKTYNPPKIEIFNNFTDDQKISWLIGFIDGDGNIKHQYGRTDTIISIHIHSSWFEVMSYFHQILNNVFNFKSRPPKILKSGFLRYEICNIKIVQELKRTAISYKLPILDRKWSIVDLNRLHKTDKKKLQRTKAKLLKSSGLSLKEVAIKMNVKYNTLCGYLYH